MTPERLARFREVVSRRQFDLTVILENVHDSHNIGAVLRSCDSVGIREIFVLYTEPQLREDRLKLGKKSSGGARRWVDVHLYKDPEACFQHVRQTYGKVLGTHLGGNAESLYDLDLTEPTALLFGNEHDGLSALSLAHADGNFIIPQMGMTRSLNISVACAVSLFEAFRQRAVKGRYNPADPASSPRHQQLFEEYIRRHEEGETPSWPIRKKE